MRLRLRRPIQALDTVYARRAVPQAQLDTFRQALTRLFSRIDEHESEEYQKTILASFFREAFGNEQDSPFTVDIHEPIDLIVRVNSASSSGDISSSGALIETRRVFAADMMTMLKNNVRALHELILYAFSNSQQDQPLDIQQFVITDAYNWFIFDKADCQAIFLDNPRLIRAYQLSQQPAKGTAFFYVEAAKILRDLDQDVPVTYLNLREAADWLALPPATSNDLLLPVYKLLSPEHLLGLPAVTDNTVARQRFYGDLLRLLGLTEIHPGRSRPALVKRLPEADRQPGSLLDITLHELQTRNVLPALPNRTVYGRNEDEQLFTFGLLLCITWIGRLLFIKLIEAQISHSQPSEDDSKTIPSLSSTHSIRTFADLNELFFDVIPVPVDQRSQDMQQRFGAFPSLNVDLFKPTDAERHAITVADLPDQPDLALAAHSSPADAPASALSNLLAFLDAYAFEAESWPVVQTDARPQLTIADLGLVFDRLVSGLSGATIVPPLVTSWVIHESLHNAVLARFNDHFGPNVTALSDKLNSVSVVDANVVFNSLRIVDPAVGSGSFLVQALNQLIALKGELGILADRQNRPLDHYTVSLTGQELFITYEDGEPFRYRPAMPGPLAHPPSPEGQRIQETIFHEKVVLLNNCLFGTDTAPTAVFTTQLQLWFDLLKHLYYDGQIPNRIGQTNTRINRTTSTNFPVTPSFPALNTIRQGNSLVSRYGPAFQVDALRQQATREKFQSMLTQYRADVLTYENERSNDVQDRIHAFQAFIDQLSQTEQPAYTTIRQLEAKLSKSALTFDFAGQTGKTQRLTQQLAAKKQRFADHQGLFEQAIDWRFTFPNVLDTDGNYVGFDVVLGSLLSQTTPLSSDNRAILKKSLPNTSSGTIEHYALFVELSMQLLRPNGQLAFVLPDRWLRTGQGLPLRRWLRTKALDWLIQFSNETVNNRYTRQAAILIARNRPDTSSVRLARFNVASFEESRLVLGSLVNYLDRNTVDTPVNSLPDTAWIDFPA